MIFDTEFRMISDNGIPYDNQIRNSVEFFPRNSVNIFRRNSAEFFPFSSVLLTERNFFLRFSRNTEFRGIFPVFFRFVDGTEFLLTFFTEYGNLNSAQNENFHCGNFHFRQIFFDGSFSSAELIIDFRGNTTYNTYNNYKYSFPRSQRRL